jgi:serine/threonine protein kinase
MKPILSILFCAGIIFSPAFCNRFSGLLLLKEHHKDEWDESYHPYVNETFIIGGKCNETPNFFREIILPFTDEQYRTLVHFKNNYFIDRGVDPVDIWVKWLGSDMATKYDFISFIANGVNGAVYRVCRKGGYCRALKIQRDRHGKYFKRYLRIKPVLKEEFLNRVYYIEHQGIYVFMVMKLGDTNLNQLIKKKVMTPVQKLNMIHDLLVALHNYMKYKLIHGDLKPANILVKIDEHKYKDNRENVMKKIRAKKDSDLMPLIADFEQYAKLVKRNGKYYKKQVYANGGSIDITDRVERKDKMRRYSPRYKSYEVWAAKKNKYGPGADIYAMGLSIHYVWFGKQPIELKKSCREISLSQCKQKLKGMSLRMNDMDLSEKTTENCVLEVVRGMMTFEPTQRELPLTSKSKLMTCLSKLGYNTVGQNDQEVEASKTKKTKQ